MHLGVSAFIGLLAAGVVFVLWFPSPFDTLAAGTQIFMLMIWIDLVAGPALTLVVADPAKPKHELRRDLALIAGFQVCVLAYGLYVAGQARPVLLAFEVDRFRIVSAAEIDPTTLPDAPADMPTLLWTGPQLIAAVKPTDPVQAFRSVQLGMAGIDLSMDPRNWRPYATQAAAAWHAAKPLQGLLQRFPVVAPEAGEIASAIAKPVGSLRYLPVQSRRMVWVAVLAEPGAKIVGYLPVDGFN